ncbi:MAG: hypothetical protein Q9168_000171 [Polycauliona sp. 1 TL-2023]
MIFPQMLIIAAWVPYASAQQNHTVVSGWVDDPNGRGTFTILSSCILTLSLCVYTSIHLNVRPYKQTELQAWLETTKWVLFGILAPELMVFVAWRQFMSARALDQIVNRLKCQSNQEAKESAVEHKENNVASTVYSLENPWSRLHSFYANMGGFVFDLDDPYLGNAKSFTNRASRLTLTPRGVALLAACGYLPKISTEDILDKNKSDNLSKVLSVLQALWMLTQIITRLYSKLHITLLEVNTLAHIICAIIIYVLWWNKPKLINEPTKIRGDWVAPIAAYMFMSSQISGWKRTRPGILKKDWIDPEFSVLAFQPPISLNVRLCASVPCATDATPDSAPGSATTIDQMDHARLTSAASSNGSWTRRPSVAFHTGGLPNEAMLSVVDSRLESSGDLRSIRWGLAAEAMSLYPALASRMVCRATSVGGQTFEWNEPLLEELVDDTIGNWATGNLLRAMSGFVMGMVVWSASVIYGGVHAAAWHGGFPSRTEDLLWRASSICIAGSGFTWIFINMFARSFPRFKSYWIEVETLQAHWTSLVGLGSLAFLCGLAYLLARIYLVVESFISLRKLPASAFQTVEWTQIVPHL